MMNIKRTIAGLLSLLMLISAMASCGKTLPAATDAVETTAAEADSFASDGNLITENGIAKAHVVLAESADSVLVYAAEELLYHAEKVSGATLSVVNEADANGLSIVIGTPDTNPEIAELFPEDMAWLTTLKEDGKQYGDDGFAIRSLNGKLYIFGATSRGAMNGVYDFIEENMGVLWIRAVEEIGLIYDEMPTIAVAKTNYREKSPFQMRGWYTWSSNRETSVMHSRNKMNTNSLMNPYPAGMEPFLWNHDLKGLVVNSPIYDPEITEYWNQYEDGTIVPIDEVSQINFWSDLTADTVAATLIQTLKDNPHYTNIGLGVEDNYECIQYPECTEPFEYAPGRFVNPEDPEYLSTVYFTFVNKVARQVKAVFPEIPVNVLAYAFVIRKPLCELEDNIRIVVTPIERCLGSEITDPDNPYNVIVYNIMEDWKCVENTTLVYDYYGCSRAVHQYERPIWRTMQKDLHYYMECGFEGTLPQGPLDNSDDPGWGGGTRRQIWDMNTLTFWLYAKLTWDPDADIDELIAYFCDKVYGAASESMQEYYRLIEQGWNEAESRSEYLWNYKHYAEIYFDVFVYQSDVEADIIAALQAAYDVAETDAIKERIRPIKESYEAAFPEY